MPLQNERLGGTLQGRFLGWAHDTSTGSDAPLERFLRYGKPYGTLQGRLFGRAHYTGTGSDAPPTRLVHFFNSKRLRISEAEKKIYIYIYRDSFPRTFLWYVPCSHSCQNHTKWLHRYDHAKLRELFPQCFGMIPASSYEWVWVNTETL